MVLCGFLRCCFKCIGRVFIGKLLGGGLLLGLFWCGGWSVGEVVGMLGFFVR